MKTLINITILFITMSHLVFSQNLPEDAKQILDKLAKFEDDELKKTEQEIIKIKQEAIKELERSERRIKSEDIKKLYAWQINKLKEECEHSEKFIKGEIKFDDVIEDVFRDEDSHEHRARRELVLFDVAYDYKHPIDEFSDQKGELVFFRDNRVKLTHKSHNGEILFEHIVGWEQRENKLYVNDEVHGRIVVRNKDGGGIKELRMYWTKLDKVVALTAR